MRKLDISYEEIVERRRASQREYANAYRRKHPDTILKHRINSARNLLEKNGYTVYGPGERK